MTVALVERKLFGGTCVNTGCMPTKTLVASARSAHVARNAGDYGIVIDGTIGVDMARVKARAEQYRRTRAKASSHGSKAWIGARSSKGTRASNPKTVVVTNLTKDDVEDVRDKIDDAVKADEIRGTTPANIWTTVTGALTAAHASKDRSLRVHAHHPAPLHDKVLPPMRSRSRKRPWLYPNEWRKLAECPAVAVEWRRLSKAWDSGEKKVKGPKTEAGYRVIRIPEALLPLLEGEGVGRHRRHCREEMPFVPDSVDDPRAQLGAYVPTSLKA